MATKIDIKSFKPEPHPLKAFFTEHNVSQSKLANYLGVSYRRCNQLMNGYCKMPKKIESKLHRLAEQLKEGNGTKRLKSLKPHPLRSFFKKQGISQPALAAYLGISFGYCQSILSGKTKMPKHHDEKLRALADQLKENTKTVTAG